MLNGIRRLLTTLVVVTMVTQSALAASTPLSRSDFDACRSQDEQALRTAITAISKAELERALKTVDYPARVRTHWRQLGVGDIVDKRVDIAVLDVTRESSWGDLLRSLTNSEKAQMLATDVAERVYQSQPVSRGIEDLVTAVAGDVGRTIELASGDSEDALLACLKAFVGPRYGESVARAMAGDAQQTLALDPHRGAGEISSGAVLKEASGGLAGATILIVRRQLATIASRVGQRIAGSVLSRLVSVVAGGIGLVLIAKDIWELRNGVLPIVATEMKAEATKEKVREEIANTISTQMSTHVDDLAQATADQVMKVWQEFKQAHALVLRIADQDAGFRGFLNGVPADRLTRLDEVVGLIAASEGDQAVVARLANGTLNTAVTTMPPQAMQIARDTRSIGEALGWSAMAEDRLDAIIAYDIHKRAKPDTFSRASLERVLALGDRTAISRIAPLPQNARDSLMLLDSAELTALAKSLAETELKTLASYLEGLNPAARDKVLRTVAAEPAKMRLISSPRVRDAMIASSDQLAAAELMLRTQTGLAPKLALADARQVWDGRISPILLWEKHPALIVGLIMLALAILLWLRRLVRPSSRKPDPDAPEPAPTEEKP